MKNKDTKEVVPQEIQNTLMDRKQERERMAYEKNEIEENQAPRKSLTETINKAKDKMTGKTVKKAKGGSVNASRRGDGCAQRGKTKGKFV